MNEITCISFLFEGPQPPFHDLFEQIQKSIDRLPSTVTRLCIYGNRTEKQVSFKNLPDIEKLWMITYSVDSSSLPSLQSLIVHASSIKEHQQLPDSLRYLNIDFKSEYPTNFATFCQTFILPLSNLTELEIRLGNANADEGIDGFASFIRSSNLFDTLETLTIYMNGNTTAQPSEFWLNFIKPLDRLLELTIYGYSLSSELIIDEYPLHLAFLKIAFDEIIDPYGKSCTPWVRQNLEISPSTRGWVHHI
ncbi:unnamed protein product [Ambrosiozyma monospora]|uniref:Unnamed protein product n=1 Tax=Ambrosiozyma monospora TaxID=43982 RepID=A0ACB5ST57_AMBMO|nr:unnamed protein product [Ambrosiozyma monospora]